MFRIVFNYASRNILRMRLRSLFTVLSIILIISLYTVLGSIGDSFTQQIIKVIEKQNVDIAVQAKYASTPISSIVKSSSVEEIKKYTEVKSVDSLLIARKRIADDTLVFILGLSNFETFSQQFGFNIIKGRTLINTQKELVVGEKMAKVLGLNVGSEFELESGRKYLIVGIYSSWLNFLNSGLMVDIKIAQELVEKPGRVSLLFLTLKDTTKLANVISKINKQFPKLKAIEGQQFPNYLGPIKSIFYFSKIVSVLTLFIAVAVLLNTFMMAVNERTKEVGILNAIGWSRKMILSVFLIESMLLSFGGGIIGYLSAYPIMYILQNNFAAIYMYLPSSPDIKILFNVLTMCLIISVVSILFPVLYSMRIHIAEAMHHE